MSKFQSSISIQIRKFELYDLLSIDDDDDDDSNDKIAYKFLKDNFTRLVLTTQEDGCYTYSIENDIILIYEPENNNIYISYTRLFKKLETLLEFYVLDTVMIYFAKKYLNLEIYSVDYMSGVSSNRYERYSNYISEFFYQ
jgi:hypothetical protein